MLTLYGTELPKTVFFTCEEQTIGLEILGYVNHNRIDLYYSK
jgi:hypothetical protein